MLGLYWLKYLYHLPKNTALRLLTIIIIFGQTQWKDTYMLQENRTVAFDGISDMLAINSRLGGVCFFRWTFTKHTLSNTKSGAYKSMREILTQACTLSLKKKKKTTTLKEFCLFLLYSLLAASDSPIVILLNQNWFVHKIQDSLTQLMK